MTGTEQVLIEDWCQQYPSHSVGSLDFGPDGALYVSGGDGASFNFVDYGQDGSPLNPCGDPPGGVGAPSPHPPPRAGRCAARTCAPWATRRAWTAPSCASTRRRELRFPTTPLAPSADPNARRIVAYGMRNPFRFAVRPGTGEVWIGDVGWNTWEEINRIQSPTAGVTNLGWPCYEGAGRQGGYDSANLSICENLYAAGAGAVQAPLFAWNHGSLVVPSETCPSGSSSAAGIAFAPVNGGSYPDEYDGALFFADYSRDCIWAMLPGASGLPDPARIRTFAAGAANPVGLQIGPGGDLFYPDFDGGTIRRVTFTSANQPPTAVATGSPTTGPAPLTVAFDGSGSSDPDAGDTLSYDWDLDGDGAYDDSTAVAPDLHVHEPRHLHGEPARHGQPRRLGYGRGDDQRRQYGPECDDHGAGGRDDLEGRRPDSVRRRCHRRAGRTASRLGALVEPDPQSLPVQLPHAPAAELSRALRAARSRRRTTSTPPTWSCGSRRPIPAGSATPSRCAWTRRRSRSRSIPAPGDSPWR